MKNLNRSICSDGLIECIDQGNNPNGHHNPGLFHNIRLALAFDDNKSLAEDYNCQPYKYVHRYSDYPEDIPHNVC